MILPGLVGMLQRRLLVAMRVAALGGGLRPPSDRRRAPDGALLRASPQDCAGQAGARTEVRHSVASLWRCAWQLSEGGCAPLPTVVARLTAHSSVPPPRIAPAKPALELRFVTASPPCGDARGSSRRGAAPPFRPSSRA